MEYNDINEQTIHTKYRPLSPWANWGYSLLFSIPIIGQICVIIFCFAGENVNRKNYARGLAISYIIIIVCMVLFWGIISKFLEEFSTYFVA